MFEISAEQIRALLNYLASKPYGEVHEGIHMLQNLKKIEEKIEE